MVFELMMKWENVLLIICRSNKHLPSRPTTSALYIDFVVLNGNDIDPKEIKKKIAK